MVSLKVLYVSLIVCGVILIYNGRIVEFTFGFADLSFEEKENLVTSTITTSHHLKPILYDKHYDHCIVHIHGFHHSGTGYLRQKVYESVGGSKIASMHNSSVASEGEGQHLQTVYPTIGERTTNPLLCFDDMDDGGDGDDDESKHPIFLPQKLGRLYYCPKLVPQIIMKKTSIQQSQQQKDKAQQLFEEWSKHWDMSKPILIQKTPSFDVLYLERMNKLLPPVESMTTTTTIHLLVMRHPLVWNHDMMAKYANQGKRKRRREPNLLRPLIWIDVWATIFDQLINSNIQSYAVIQYETLGLTTTTTTTTTATTSGGVAEKNQISRFVMNECHVENLLLSSSTTTEGTPSPTNTSTIKSTSNSTTSIQRQQLLNETTRKHVQRQRHQRRRRLHVYEAKASEFYKPKQEIVDLMVQCRADVQCRSVMKDLEPIIDKYFGYKWDTKQMFKYPLLNPNNNEIVNDGRATTLINNRNSSSNNSNKTQDSTNKNQQTQYPQILFSSSNPPPIDLVQGLLDLKAKYC